MWPSPRDLLGTSREQIHKLKIEAKWFISFGIFKNKDSEYQVEAEPHLNQTLKRRLEPPKMKPPDPSPPWSHVDEGTSTTVEFLTVSGWVMNAQQTRERSSRWSHHTHCAGTNLPRRGVFQHLHGSKLPMKTVTARGNEAFTSGSLRRGCGMGARSCLPIKAKSFPDEETPTSPKLPMTKTKRA